MAKEHLDELGADIAEKLRLRSQSGRRSFSSHPVEGRTILLVDDNAEYRSLVKALLVSRKSCHVVEAADGRSAVARIKQGHLDLVILDFDIPKMNGYEVLQEIRSRYELRGLPVIMLTGVSNRLNLKNMDMDISAFLEKPVSRDDILQSVTKTLEAAYGNPPSAVSAPIPSVQAHMPSSETSLGAGWSAVSAFPPRWDGPAYDCRRVVRRRTGSTTGSRL